MSSDATHLPEIERRRLLALAAPVAVVRYVARISFDESPGMLCWHTDCYRQRDGGWQAVWSQATRIASPDNGEHRADGTTTR